MNRKLDAEHFEVLDSIVGGVAECKLSDSDLVFQRMNNQIQAELEEVLIGEPDTDFEIFRFEI